METKAFTIEQFSQAHGISRAMFYKLLNDGSGPRTFKAGKRTLISVEAAAEWRRQREAVSSAKVKLHRRAPANAET